MTQFDEVRDRRKTGSVKWDGLSKRFKVKNRDVLAMWVADMDFDPADPIKRDLTDLATNQVLGYKVPSESFYQSQINWQKDQHNVELKQEDILLAPSVIASLGVIIQTFSQVGDQIMVHDPTYNGFFSIIKSNQRKCVQSPLNIVNGQFRMNFDDIESQFKESTTKIFILSNPHNPGGRVWSKAEITQLADLCLKYGVLLVSDEIHIDLVYSDAQATAAYTLDEKYFKNLIVLHSATKTFNIAGTKCATYFIKDRKLRTKVAATMASIDQEGLSSFGLVAAEAAFAKSRTWYNELMAYLKENRQLITNFFDMHLPEVDYIKPESTYLFWFNARAIGLEGKDLEQHFVKEGQVALVNGLNYGNSSPTWMRLNFATSRHIVEAGLKGIKTSFDNK